MFRDCDRVSLTGLQINNVWRQEGGLVLRRCRDFNISGCTILDCDGCGVLMDDVQDTIVSGCTIRDTRKQSAETTALIVKKGKNNFITNNILTGLLQIVPGAAKLVNNFEK